MSAVVAQITMQDVRESVAVARSHGEKFFEQIVWQVENEAWSILGYASWDAMREGEYGDMGVVAPRADRPELVSRMRAKGLTQSEIAGTLGVDQKTVSRDLNRQMPNEDAPPTITNSRGQERPSTYKRTETTTVEESVDARTGELIDYEDGFTCESCDNEFAFDYAVETPVGFLCVECNSNRVAANVPAKPAPKADRRRPLPDAARDAGWDLRKAVEKIERIHQDDRFARNENEVTPQLRSHLIYAIETCQGILDGLTTKEQ